MLSEDHEVLHVYDVHGIVSIVLFQELEDLELDPRLVVVLLLVLDDLQSYELLPLVVKALDCLAEATLPQKGMHLITVADVISDHHLIVTLVVIVPIVVVVLVRALDFLGALADVVNLREI